MFKNISFLFFLAVIISACHFNVEKQPSTPPIFRVLTDTQTGLHFQNHLKPSPNFNMFKYMYFYNGAGVGAGDFNNDGKIDLFFTANQGDNKLYLNKGGLKFEDVTQQAGIPEDGEWSTGVSVVDINNDGLLDIYICRVGHYEVLNGHNQLLICTGIDSAGIPHYKDEAKAYGLDFSGFSTQAVFFDYDMDGDLDMFLLNHSVHQNGLFAPRKNFLGTYDSLSGDRIYRNNGNHTFTDVTRQTGINSSAISYGLGVVVADINLDGYPDLYVGNDFHENDYLYINQKNGTFSEENNQRLMHTSQFSMGVDVADVNNDGYPEIISMDMLPFDPYILKRSLGEDEYDIFYHKIDVGYNYQYTRNNLQLNRRNGMFSEIGLYSGVYATDWSWAPLWMDFDNDGKKDLFISNGIPKRMNDMDYVNFVSNEEIQKKINSNTIADQDMALVNKFPEIKIPNKFYRNSGQMVFVDEQNNIQNNQPTYSNGAVYADLDNDGDLDVVVNNIDEPVMVYENTTNNGAIKKSYLELNLKGPGKNIHALGSKVIVYANGGIRTYEKYPTRGFQSSMEIPLHIGLDSTKIDSAFLIWPDNTYQRLGFAEKNTTITLQYKKGLPKFNYANITAFHPNTSRPMEDITEKIHLNYLHKENHFVEFDRESLIPHMVSTEGPALAVADINHDGLEDVFIGASKTFKSAVFLQKPNGTFQQLNEPTLNADSTYEDVDATWVDVNNDGNVDLVIASGGNEYYGMDERMQPRVYLNDGKGNLSKLPDAFKNIYMTASSVSPFDFNGDGFVDVFIGGRAVPWNYGQTPTSYLLLNDGKGHFTDVTEKYAKGLSNIGLVTQGIWFDLNKDGKKDLIVTTEWNGIYAFMSQNGQFVKTTLTNKKGWWNFVLPVDVNNDGQIDLIAGNLGLNSRLKATEKEPVRLYVNDFDDNGHKEQVLTYYLEGKEIPFANKDELQKQIPILKKRFLYAENFAKATLPELFTQEKLSSATVLEANYFSNAVLLNNGNMHFTVQALPWQAQLSPYKTGVVLDTGTNGLPNIFLGGNFYDNNIQMGRYDADFGTILTNNGHQQFTASTMNGLIIKGQIRHILPIAIGGRNCFILARNNDSTMVIGFEK
ncbi:VCBS repeat-containing protein [Hydrotalea sp.]|uniref:VCBS repeat-containing protein n=1 Tax=Hydrotalea sp. TaxID=2881279 RepID=UPI002586D474|nr:VCBS repeat-containing protein [Hydrotalea sp.]